jgi:glycosyltransferase involved in cell wall biosynthesis
VVSRKAPVTVIPNAVEWERFAQTTERDPALAAQLGLTAGKTLGFVGSFYDYEGLDLLIDAMPALLAEDPQIRLLLVGGGLQDAALRERTRQLGLQAAVHFTGRVPFTEVERYYALIDVLVYPRKSLRLTELVTPLKPLEAMAQRKALVASDVGGHRELIEHGRTGLLYAAGRQESLVDQVLTLVRSPGLQQGLIDQGLAFVRDERTWAHSVDGYTAVYRLK